MDRRALLALAPALLAATAAQASEPTKKESAGQYVDPAVAGRIVEDILTTAAEDGRTVLLISHTDAPEHLITRRLRLESGTLVA